MFKKQQEEGDDFRKRREQYSVGIRRADREAAINKRRHGNSAQETYFGEITNEENDNIVDERYRPQILQMVNFNYDVSMFKTLVGLLYGADVLEIHRGIIGLRKLLNNDGDALFQDFIDAGLIQKSMELMEQEQFPQLKLEAAWALTNLASGPTEFCQALVNRGAIEKFLQLLHQNQKGVVDQAVWGLGNIAADQIVFRDKIVKLGGINALIKVVQSSSSKGLLRNGIWAITNICRGTPPPAYDKIQAAIPIIAKALMSGLITSKEVLSDCSWSIAMMCEGPKSRIQRVLETGVLPQFFKFAEDQYRGLYLPSIRVIGNFSTGNEIHTEELMKNGVLNLMTRFMGHPKAAIRREVCWITSNLAAGTASQVRALIQHEPIMKKCVELMETDVVEVRREICWVFSNMGHLGPKRQVINYYIQNDIVRHYVNLLAEEDATTLDMVLESLYKLLLVGMRGAENGKNLVLGKLLEYNGGERLQQLQNHSSMKVYERTVKILTKFFVVEEAESMF